MAEEKCPRNLAKFTISPYTGIFKFMRPRLREWYQSISEIVLYKVEEKIFELNSLSYLKFSLTNRQTFRLISELLDLLSFCYAAKIFCNTMLYVVVHNYLLK